MQRSKSISGTAMIFTDFVLEDASFAWLESLGWTVKHGAEITPGQGRRLVCHQVRRVGQVRRRKTKEGEP